MNRRRFIKNSSLIGAASAMPLEWLKSKDLVIGHNDFQYKVDKTWGVLDKTHYPVKDCHEMVVDKDGRIIMLTNETKNNILIYNQKGKLVESWGSEYPGGHGLTINDEGGEEFLYICDNNRGEVIKTDLKGKVVMTIPYPKDADQYDDNPYVPTESAIASNGDIYVADGYGSQYILHYDEKGRIKNVFGGPGEEDHLFHNAHGVAIDTRSGEEKLMITARNKNQFKYFDLDGNYQSTIDLPGAFVCRPVIHGDQVYVATIWTGKKEAGSGMITILDKNDKVVSVPGGNEPSYIDHLLQPLHQTMKVFVHPHDVCVDQDENIYVCQWNAGQVYPYKLLRV